MVYFPHINECHHPDDSTPGYRKSPVMNQFNEPEDVFENFNQQLNENYPTIVCHHYFHPFSTNLQENKSTEQVIFDGNNYVINFEVSQFNIHELDVLIMKNRVLAVGGLKENDANNKDVKNFKKYIMLPSDCDINSIKSRLTRTGILRITAKKE